MCWHMFYKTCRPWLLNQFPPAPIRSPFWLHQTRHALVHKYLLEDTRKIVCRRGVCSSHTLNKFAVNLKGKYFTCSKIGFSLLATNTQIQSVYDTRCNMCLLVVGARIVLRYSSLLLLPLRATTLQTKFDRNANRKYAYSTPTKYCI